MITLLTGENSFEVEAELKAIIMSSQLEPEKIDGSTLELNILASLLTGATLFVKKRLIIIKNLSENTQIWADFIDWLPRISDDIDLVLVDAKPDKRTRTYKELQRADVIKEFAIWTDKDIGRILEWIVKTGKLQGVELNKKCAQLIVDRVGLDQWQLWHAIEKLSLLNKFDEQDIINVIDTNPTENVFNLFEAALKSDRATVTKMVRRLELTEDPFRLFGLLAGQAYQLAILSVSEQSSNQVAKDIGAHPYALSKLAPYAKKLGRSGTRKVIACFARSDDDMKISAGEPWLLIERALLNITNI